MSEKLSPLSKDEFADLYNKAWENGWVYGKFFDELHDEYLVNWVYFVDYLDILSGKTNGDRMYERINTDKDVVKIEFGKEKIFVIAPDHLFKNLTTCSEYKVAETISFLIGEAPPYWKGNATPDDKSYFYNPNYKKSSTWFTAPLKWKVHEKKGLNDVKEKLLELISMAQAGVILFDMFPFPIIQDTAVRVEITGGFSGHLEAYFFPKYEEICKYITIKNIQHGLVATEYGSIQFLCDQNIQENDTFKNIIKKPIDFYFYINDEDLSKFLEQIEVLCCKKELVDFSDASWHNFFSDHYEDYKKNHIPIFKKSTKTDKDNKVTHQYNYSDKYAFMKELIDGNKGDLVIIPTALERISKLPIFMKGIKVIITDQFLNGTL
jgi:hypothetical protein